MVIWSLDLFQSIVGIIFFCTSLSGLWSAWCHSIMVELDGPPPKAPLEVCSCQQTTRKKHWSLQSGIEIQNLCPSVVESTRQRYSNISVYFVCKMQFQLIFWNANLSSPLFADTPRSTSVILSYAQCCKCWRISYYQYVDNSCSESSSISFWRHAGYWLASRSPLLLGSFLA